MFCSEDHSLTPPFMAELSGALILGFSPDWATILAQRLIVAGYPVTCNPYLLMKSSHSCENETFR